MFKSISIAIIVSFFFSCNSSFEDKHHNEVEQNGKNSENTSSGVSELHTAMNSMMEQMKNMEPTGDADHDFASMMKIHHQGAIDMGKIEMTSGTDEEMRDMALKIVDQQSGDIAEFDSFIRNHTPESNSRYGEKMKGSMAPVGAMKMTGQSLDAMFAAMMVPHHQDGLKMAEEYLKEGKSEDLKRIASKMLVVHPAEIKVMQNWLAKQGQSPKK